MSSQFVMRGSRGCEIQDNIAANRLGPQENKMAIYINCSWQGKPYTVLDKTTVGYLTDLDGLGTSSGLAKDLTVTPPQVATCSYTPLGWSPYTQIKVVGILASISWNGTAGGAVQIEVYVSQANAQKLMAANQTTTDTRIQSIGWWVAGYDERSASWFEQFYPKNPMKPAAVVPEGNLNVNIHGAPIGTGSLAPKVTMQIQPPRNGAAVSLLWSSAPGVNAVHNWASGVRTLAG
jgi:hypothetical protein